MIRVFLVDDMPDVRAVIRSYLEREGDRYTVVGEADNGRDALDMIPHAAPDVILMDVCMLGLSGPEVINSLRASGDYTPVVLCSSGVESIDTESPGWVLRLAKPFRFEWLEAMLRTAAFWSQEARLSVTGS